MSSAEAIPHPASDRVRTERRALLLSPLGYLVFGLLGVVFFLIVVGCWR